MTADPRRGVCALPELDETGAALRATGGVRSHLSAVQHTGWAVKTAPDVPMMKVDRRQRVDGPRRAGVRLYWRQVSAEERAAGVTVLADAVALATGASTPRLVRR